VAISNEGVFEVFNLFEHILCDLCFSVLMHELYNNNNITTVVLNVQDHS